MITNAINAYRVGQSPSNKPQNPNFKGWMLYTGRGRHLTPEVKADFFKHFAMQLRERGIPPENIRLYNHKNGLKEGLVVVTDAEKKVEWNHPDEQRVKELIDIAHINIPSRVSCPYNIVHLEDNEKLRQCRAVDFSVLA